MTKGGGFTLRAGRHHRADFHLSMIADDPINESFHQWSALGKAQWVKRWRATVANHLDALGHRRPIDVRLGLGIALPQWLP